MMMNQSRLPKFTYFNIFRITMQAKNDGNYPPDARKRLFSVKPDATKTEKTTMSIRNLITTLDHWARWLYYKPWEPFELLALALIVSALLLTIVSRRQHARRLRESSQSGPPRDFRGL